MKTAWHKLFILLFAMTAIGVVINLNHFLECDADAKQEVVARNWTTLEIILLRQCRATWPLMLDEYDICISKIAQMYREDI